MGVLSENAIIGASAAGGYDIDYSCRFDDVGGSKLTRTPSSAGNLKTWTLSFWMKQAITGASSQFVIFDGGGVSSSETPFGIVDQCIEFNYWNSGTSSQSFKLKTNQVFRDQSAWYHIVCAYDSPQATAANRLKLYVNGSQVTSFSTANYPAQNLDATVNAAYEHYIGTGKQAQDWSGYLADFNLIDGLALTPASFAETDVLTNEWKAKKYGGAYGTNGFFLEFKSSGALGTDTSGNGHNWTSTNLAATDQMIDTPQNSTGGNFATWNPLCYSPYSTFHEGNLKHVGSGGSNSGNTPCTFTPPAAGKWYWEEHCSNIANTQWPFIGTVDATVYEKVGTWSDNNGRPGESESNGGWKISADGEYETDGGGTTTGGVSFNDTTDIIQFALDHDNGALYYGKNNVWYTPTATTGDPTSGASRTGAVMTWTAGARSFIPAVQNYNTSAMIGNFGQDSSFAGNVTAQGNKDGNNYGDFYYTPPTGYLAICSDNLPDPAIALPGENFNTILWTGDGTSPRSFTGVGFTPDLSWTKNRNTGVSHQLYDTIRGAGNDKELASDSANAEGGGNAETYGYLSAFGSDGFTTTDGSGSPNYYFNENTKNFVSWNWKAGGTASNNTDGTTTSSVSANTTAGFSIVSYAGSGSAGATVGHGLSQTPDLIIIKNRSGITNWVVNSPIIDSTFVKWAMKLDITEAISADTTIWNSTAPSASVFTLGTAGESNRNNPDNYIAYCFHSVEGYSKIGKYDSNNNADGPFIYLGFTPAFIMLKCTNATDNWNLYDIKRDGYNGTGGTYQLRADGTDADFTSAATMVDLVSNGMKIRTNDPGTNGSSRNYLYLAFAESPFKTARAR